MTKTELNSTRTLGALFYDCGSAIHALNEFRYLDFSPFQLGLVMRERTSEGVLVDGQTPRSLTPSKLDWIPLPEPRRWYDMASIPWISAGLLSNLFALSSLNHAHWLEPAGLSQEELEYFERGLFAGAVMVIVRPKERGSEAIQVFECNGGDLGPQHRHARGPISVSPVSGVPVELTTVRRFGPSADQFRHVIPSDSDAPLPEENEV